MAKDPNIGQCRAGIPHPVWPGFNRRSSKRRSRNNGGVNIEKGIESWLQPSKDIYADISDEYDSIVTDSLLLMTETKKTKTADKHHEDMDKVIKQLKEALSRSRRLSTLKRAFSRSDHKQRKPLLVGSLRRKNNPFTKSDLVCV